MTSPDRPPQPATAEQGLKLYEATHELVYALDHIKIPAEGKIWGQAHLPVTADELPQEIVEAFPEPIGGSLQYQFSLGAIIDEKTYVNRGAWKPGMLLSSTDFRRTEQLATGERVRWVLGYNALVAAKSSFEIARYLSFDGPEFMRVHDMFARRDPALIEEMQEIGEGLLKGLEETVKAKYLAKKLGLEVTTTAEADIVIDYVAQRFTSITGFPSTVDPEDWHIWYNAVMRPQDDA